MQKAVQILIKMLRWHISGRAKGKGADWGDFNLELKTAIREGESDAFR